MSSKTLHLVVNLLHVLILRLFESSVLKFLLILGLSSINTIHFYDGRFLLFLEILILKWLFLFHLLSTKKTLCDLVQVQILLNNHVYISFVRGILLLLLVWFQSGFPKNIKHVTYPLFLANLEVVSE
jgi:hypothetical protein